MAKASTVVIGAVLCLALIVGLLFYRPYEASPPPQVIPTDYNPKQILPCYGSICQNMVGYWPLDEGSGTSANDLSGNGNVGTLTNSPTWKSGGSCEFGSCLSLLAASDQYVRVASPSLNDFSNAQDHTYTVWVSPNGAPSGLQIVIGFSGNTGGTDIAITTSGGNICVQFLFAAGAFSYTPCNIHITANTFSLISAAYSGSGNSVCIYVDAALDACSGNLGRTWGSESIPIYFGRYYSTSALDFNGVIDDAHIYTAVLTATQIAQLYAYGLEYHN